MTGHADNTDQQPVNDVNEVVDVVDVVDVAHGEFAGWGDLPVAGGLGGAGAGETSLGEGHNCDDPSGLIQVFNDTFEDFDRRLIGLETEVAAMLEAGPEAKPRVLDHETVAVWVGWLIDAYQLDDKIPAQWETVPGVHQELTALCAAWAAAYDPETQTASTGFGAAQWHDALSRTLERIQFWSNAQATRSNRSR